ncbi:UbiX family flavin prenyltransferase [Sorangium sp. So ce1182]|uniref:UbiX family flavin prenyltransferase n=1 Tax=Sorangium sp. So ce1182 TaxID=3133334 RepID=UPI003F5EDB38
MNRKHIIIALTGASGGIYFLRTVRALLRDGHRVDLIMSKYGLLTLKEETDFRDHDGQFIDYLYRKYGDEVRRGEVVTYAQHDQTAPIASGSGGIDGMAIVPCTMKTLSGVAHGSSGNLIERAADVMLKERKRLVLVPREAPYNLIHLRNMVAVTEAGAVVLPASPAFYQRPETLEDLGDFIAQRVLKLFGIDAELSPKWTGLRSSART